jgi:predicted  nucleic acid-binding Zn-ribbon protein
MELAPLDLVGLTAAVSAGIATILGAVAGLRRARRTISSEVADAVSRNAAIFTDALASMEGELAETKGRLRAIEEELADARRQALRLREAIDQLTAAVEAALVILEPSRDPSAEAAASVLRTTRRKPRSKQSAPRR